MASKKKFFRKSQYNTAECKYASDMVVYSDQKNIPLVIFDCKSNIRTQSLHEGISRLITYGMSLRHKLKLATGLKLVLFTPICWCVACLPPFRSELSRSIEFESFLIFQMMDNKHYLNRKSYLLFLEDLREHFLKSDLPQVFE